MDGLILKSGHFVFAIIYKNIAPGTLSFKVYGTAQGALIGDYEIPDLQAGKIYTIYFTGTSVSGTTAHSIVHN